MTDESTAVGPPPRLSDDDRDRLAALVAPYLRAADVVANPDDASDDDLVREATSWALVDALHAAGVLVLDDTQDRAGMRRSWAALSEALVLLAARRPLPLEVLGAVPMSHQSYLAGHQALQGLVAQAYQREQDARAVTDLIRAWALEGPAVDERLLGLLAELDTALGRPGADVDGVDVTAMQDPAPVDLGARRRLRPPAGGLDALVTAQPEADGPGGARQAPTLNRAVADAVAETYQRWECRPNRDAYVEAALREAAWTAVYLARDRFDAYRRAEVDELRRRLAATEREDTT